MKNEALKTNMNIEYYVGYYLNLKHVFTRSFDVSHLYMCGCDSLHCRGPLALSQCLPVAVWLSVDMLGGLQR